MGCLRIGQWCWIRGLRQNVFIVSVIIGKDVGKVSGCIIIAGMELVSTMVDHNSWWGWKYF